MRRHAKRRIAATISVIAALVAVLSLSASAMAAPTYAGDGARFGCTPTTKCGAFESWNPIRVAINEQTGDVYVLDNLNDAIQVFTSTGTYKEQILGSSTAKGTLKIGGNLNLNDLAVDNSGGPNQGSIYLVSGAALPKEENVSEYAAFEPDGDDKWQVLGTGTPCGIGVRATDGKLFGSAETIGVQELDPATGAAVGSPLVNGAFGEEDTCQIAFDSQADLLLRLRFGGGSVNKLLAPSYATPGSELSGSTVQDVAVNTNTDRVYVTKDNQDLRWYESNGTGGEAFTNSGVGGRAYRGIAVNSNTGRIYVGDHENNLIEVFDVAGKLKVSKTGNAAGTGKVECKLNGGAAEPCAASYGEGADVELVATPGTGSTFGGFTGACTGPTCSLTPIDQPIETEVFAKFELNEYELAVTKTGTGTGTVTSDIVGINCGATCKAEYTHGKAVKLSAKASTGSTFSGWAGACTGTGACEVTMDAAKAVTATFTLIPPKEEPKTDPPAGGGGSGGGGGTTTNPPPPPPEDKLGPCLAKANKAAAKARKAAKAKKGKAKARALKAANKRKAKAIKACKAQFA